jgi:hypothetical protein
VVAWGSLWCHSYSQCKRQCKRNRQSYHCPVAPAGPLHLKLSFLLCQAAHLPGHWCLITPFSWLPAAITFPAVFVLDSLHTLKLMPAEVLARLRPPLAAGCRVLVVVGRLLAGARAVGGGLLAVRVPWVQLLLHFWCSWVCMVSGLCCCWAWLIRPAAVAACLQCTVISVVISHLLRWPAAQHFSPGAPCRGAGRMHA